MNESRLNQENMPVGLLEVLVRRSNGCIIGDDYVAWALRALEANIESSSLITLAGLPARIGRADTEIYFESALEELAIHIPEQKTLLLKYLTQVAQEISAGSIDVKSALDKIHKQVINPLNHPEELRGWCYLWEGNHPDGFGEVSELDFDSYVRGYAQRFLQTVGDNSESGEIV